MKKWKWQVRKKINADWRVKMGHVADCIEWLTRE
ncbi:unnamed protein product [Arabidopsis thaliana]|uniref:Uncharacterized protein n=4 Tax=Arabidopsis TaxID=3701 RepID=A0A654EPC5_ARATH|nr:uncharacterized protein AT1G74929 [Arabidopsis thaliana]KAG7651741.1 hypothetical protein ISN45_At01g065710 [Arabidopsis thaliana x Arabidopsis arenosa]KAG7659606.1 hypothetical protein ISN44_As01g064610 [Arabidopsis suecica]AEE35651.1 hypothetical protein AT1G74929 [Arabidopsis thaliana]CAA0335566.1 unnamed protein product [Arabidopsis thaliana]VYS51064.1 unnamed protein product [Arabidopsis thaliana]|eukprot:NP_001117601.1 hypothetical protein AT1G74929 [Arabidopsis thaliana]